MLQAHNPNYLKGSSPTSSRKNGSDDLHEAYDNIDEIPIAELNLDVPLKVHCKSIELFGTESNDGFLKTNCRLDVLSLFGVKKNRVKVTVLFNRISLRDVVF